jgi:hypothetical protein
MTAAVRDLGLAMARLSLDTEDRLPAPGASPGALKRTDAHLAIQELQVLRADLDLVAPPEAAALAEPLVELFRGQLTSGDHLRLPMPAQHDAAGIRGAMSRILEVDASALVASKEAITKEARMRTLLRGIQGAVDTIQRHANLQARY